MAVTLITKALAGVEDIAFDVSGNHDIAIRQGSEGQAIPVRRLNASHLPVTADTREQDGHDGSDNGAITVDAAIKKIFEQLFDIGKPDDSTVEANGAGGSRVLRLKALGVGTSHIQAGAVGTTEIAALAITTALIASGAVNADKLAANAVTAAKILNGAVTTDKVADSAITGIKIADGTIGRAKIDFDGAQTDPGGFIVEMGTHSLSGGGPTEAANLNSTPGGTDIAIVSPVSIASAIHLEYADISGSQISYHFSGDPGAGAQMNYLIVRPVTA